MVRRSRSNVDHGSTGGLHQRGTLCRQYPAPGRSGLFAAFRGDRNRRSRPAPARARRVGRRARLPRRGDRLRPWIRGEGGGRRHGARVPGIDRAALGADGFVSNNAMSEEHPERHRPRHRAADQDAIATAILPRIVDDEPPPPGVGAMWAGAGAWPGAVAASPPASSEEAPAPEQVPAPEDAAAPEQVPAPEDAAAPEDV